MPMFLHQCHGMNRMRLQKYPYSVSGICVRFPCDGSICFCINAIAHLYPCPILPFEDSFSNNRCVLRKGKTPKMSISFFSINIIAQLYPCPILPFEDSYMARIGTVAAVIDCLRTLFLSEDGLKQELLILYRYADSGMNRMIWGFWDLRSLLM
jgi:hypothetical protein